MLYVKAGRLIDGTGAQPLEGGAVLVDGERVVEAGPVARVAQPEGAEAIDFGASTLLPGLVDCHSHVTFRGDGSTLEETMEDPDDLMLLLGAQNARRAVEAGVTTLRDCGGRGATTFTIREGIRRDYVLGPRLLISGRPITVPGGHCWPLGGEAEGIDGVRQAVHQLVEEGVDWIKVMASGGGTKGTNPHLPSYTTDELRAIVQTAHGCGKLVAAHCSCVAGMSRLLDAGVDMIVHGNFYDADGTYRFEPEVAARIADTGTWLNPTLHVCRSRIWRLQGLAERRNLTDDERENLAGQEAYWAVLSDAFQRMLKLGVRLVAGSDSGWSYYPFGQFAEEVDAMVEAGMSPPEALASATRLSAEAVGMAHLVGTLEPGKAADLLVVDGNPMEDIRALTRVVAVYKNGQRINRTASRDALGHGTTISPAAP